MFRVGKIQDVDFNEVGMICFMVGIDSEAFIPANKESEESLYFKKHFSYRLQKPKDNSIVLVGRDGDYGFAEISPGVYQVFQHGQYDFAFLMDMSDRTAYLIDARKNKKFVRFEKNKNGLKRYRKNKIHLYKTSNKF